jgi:hypothetical protein
LTNTDLDPLLPFAGIGNSVQFHVFKLVEQFFIGPRRNAVKRRLVAVQNGDRFAARTPMGFFFNSEMLAILLAKMRSAIIFPR